MKPLLTVLRVLCLALLLPAAMVAQTGHATAGNSGCAAAASMAAQDMSPGMHVADAAFGDQGPGHGPSVPCLFCGLHACAWIEAPETFVARPLAMAPASYASALTARPPTARAESLHRPPRHLS
ncbi:hypothetical protein [Rhodovulum kholense]|uniref:DUF2946 family protein n=1 Tax=Rhodovulum kholense TaxID=453584 RepID=A0A8E2VJI3_9RHOB|nr:hypothetical protein [Rhodovulum kholense]PTW48262.1 hypothetical protein C8N38_10811 [Rhodovulum kholense]